MKESYCIIFTTCGTKKEAQKISRGLVEEKLAACVQTIDGESCYEWKGRIFYEKEAILFIKTKKNLYKKVEKFITENHSYETPEILCSDVTDGSKRYLAWISKNVKHG